MDLAETMIEEFKPRNPKIIEIGIRPGEKIHETLISSTEWNYSNDFGKFYIIHPQINIQGVGFNYDVITKKDHKNSKYSSDQGPFLNKKDIRAILKTERII
jgi:FlaA1/EpsC-like NDP-sugar epimerase